MKTLFASALFASAVVIGTLAGTGDARAEGGCGPYRHRNEAGYCRPNRPPPPRYCPPYTHPTPYGCRRD